MMPLLFAIMGMFMTAHERQGNSDCFLPDIGAKTITIDSIPELKDVKRFSGSSHLLFNDGSDTYQVKYKDSITSTPMYSYSKSKTKLNENILCWNEEKSRQSDILNDYYNMLNVFFFETHEHVQFAHDVGFTARLKLSKYHPNHLYMIKSIAFNNKQNMLSAVLMLWNLKTGAIEETADLSLLPKSNQSCLDNVHIVETNNPQQYLIYDRYFGAQKSWVFNFEDFTIHHELPYKCVTSACCSANGSLVAIGYEYYRIAMCSSNNLDVPLKEIILEDYVVEKPMRFIKEDYVALCITKNGYCNQCRKTHKGETALSIFNKSNGKMVFKKSINGGYSLNISPVSSQDSCKFGLVFRDMRQSSAWSTAILPYDLESLAKRKISYLYSLLIHSKE